MSTELEKPWENVDIFPLFQKRWRTNVSQTQTLGSGMFARFLFRFHSDTVKTVSHINKGLRIRPSRPLQEHLIIPKRAPHFLPRSEEKWYISHLPITSTTQSDFLSLWRLAQPPGTKLTRNLTQDWRELTKRSLGFLQAPSPLTMTHLSCPPSSSRCPLPRRSRLVNVCARPQSHEDNLWGWAHGGLV